MRAVTESPNSSSAPIRFAATISLALAVLLVAAVVVPQPAHAQAKLTTLHSFNAATAADGLHPNSPLARDKQGNLYGITFGGGLFRYGTVFKLSPTGTETVLHSFASGPDGGFPYGGAIIDAAGNVYGTTYQGGAFGVGTVFKVDSSGHQSVLYSFQSEETGWFPQSTLVRDAAGNFYGTTNQGGASSTGVVFKIDPTGNETVLYTFTGGADGYSPNATLVRDTAGNLYGTTYLGGAFTSHCLQGCGTVFKLSATGTETVLQDFTAGTVGMDPYVGVARDAAGNLYGTVNGGLNGYGEVFKLSPLGAETVLYSFIGGTDAASPGALVTDTAGNFYGTASGGTYGHGCVFKLDAAGHETILHSFTGNMDGGSPLYYLIRDSAGNLYGTTSFGGTYGYGTVFELTP